MPESFESMLAAMAQEAAAETGGPSAAEVRRRGRQRSARRRLLASVAAFTAVLGLLAGGAADRILRTDPSTSTAAARPSTSVVPAAGFQGQLPASPSFAVAPPVRSTAGSPSGPRGSEVPDPGLVTGLWARSDGTNGYLIVYPLSLSGSPDSAVIGISEAGAFPLCYGRVSATAVGSAYQISDVNCGGAAAADMTLTYDDPGGQSLVLHAGASAGVQQGDIPYSVQAMSPASAQALTTFGQVVGTWVNGSGQVTVDQKGQVSWSVLSHGSRQSGSAKAVGTFAGGIPVLGSCPVGGAGCAVLQLEYSPQNDQLTVIGSYGPQAFSRKG